MGRAKLPRKSTNIDMTAMCDVAFLLLSFFILATKQKPPEAVAVQSPASISSTAAPEKSILITLTKEGKCFVILGDETKKKDIINDLNTTRSLGLTPEELNKMYKQAFYGMPLNTIKGTLALNQEIPADKLAGIPISDSLNNELVDWVRSVTNVYAKSGMTVRELGDMIIIKGDNLSKYPMYKNLKFALKKNDVYKFRIATNSEAIPVGSEIYLHPPEKKK